MYIKFLNIIYDTWIDSKKIETKKYTSNYIETITQNEFQEIPCHVS